MRVLPRATQTIPPAPCRALARPAPLPGSGLPEPDL